MVLWRMFFLSIANKVLNMLYKCILSIKKIDSLRAKMNTDNRKFGIRYLAAWVNEISFHPEIESDHQLSGELFFLQKLNHHKGLRRSQLGQDVFAFIASLERSDGYFVEVGAHDPESLSNTWFLEQKGWNGILIEANPESYNTIKSSARKARVLPYAAWNKSDLVLKFNATLDSALGSISDIKQNDNHDRSKFIIHEVKTKTLDDILQQENSPKKIDYISIDVEGAELEVLEGLSLDKWNVTCLTVEWNHIESRLDCIDKKLMPYGYIRVFDIASDFDAFYVKSNVYKKWLESLKGYKEAN